MAPTEAIKNEIAQLKRLAGLLEQYADDLEKGKREPAFVAQDVEGVRDLLNAAIRNIRFSK